MHGRKAGNSLPQQKQGSILSLIFRANERSSEFECRAELFEEPLVVAEQGARIKSADALLLQNLSCASCAIGSDEFALGRIPKQDVPVVLVEGIEVAALARALSSLAERPFPQASNFQKCAGDFGRHRNVDGKIAALNQPIAGRKLFNFVSKGLWGNRLGDQLLNLRGKEGARGQGAR